MRVSFVCVALCQVLFTFLTAPKPCWCEPVCLCVWWPAVEWTSTWCVCCIQVVTHSSWPLTKTKKTPPQFLDLRSSDDIKSANKVTSFTDVMLFIQRLANRRQTLMHSCFHHFVARMHWGGRWHHSEPTRRRGKDSRISAVSRDCMTFSISTFHYIHNITFLSFYQDSDSSSERVAFI